MKFTCKIDGTSLRCTLTSDRDITAPIFCFSCFVPTRVADGGTWLTSTGGYTEIQLPDLIANQSHSLTLHHENPEFHPANRAWMPLGPYLRHADGRTKLPPLPAGVHSAPPPEIAPFNGLCLIPQPTEWVPSGGEITITGFTGEGDTLLSVDALANRQNLAPFLVDNGHPVTITTAEMPPDAYRLEITPTEIRLSAASDGGHFYGAITLLTLLNTHNGALPCGRISDAPRFNWRGQHLDCARHFYEPDTIRELLDLMALLKLNRFHWHFADDEAFRVEIDCFRELWQKTAFRGEGELVPGVFGGGIRAGGSYSKSDVADLIAHATALNIDILPEIEVPAHALALARVFPETRDPNDTGVEKSVQGYSENVLNPAMPKTWEVLVAIATEIAEIFPFNHLHLGCDELPEHTWMGSPRARNLMTEHGLQTTEDLQGWIMHRLAATLPENTRPAAWEEAAQGSNGGIGHNAILFSWTGQTRGIEAARAGYDVVMTPAQNAYLDMARTDDPDDWGANWAAYITLADTIAWEPIPNDAPDIADKIIGVQGCFWSEFTTNDAELMPMLMPRILGVALKAWQSKVGISAGELGSLAAHYQSMLGS